MNRTILIIVMTLLYFFSEVKAQNKVINICGKITDEKGAPIPGANIIVKGAKERAVSNSNGEFELKNVSPVSTLVITSIGFKKKEIRVNKEEIGSIVLISENTALEEVEVNAGYYTVKDRERTGSISSIKADAIGKQPVGNLLEAMQGRIPGVYIQSTGIAGGSFNVRIRGTNSIANGNDPLYIVDGIPFSTTVSAPGLGSGILGQTPNALSMINPSNILSIEVLKDADATAIYGSRGANGVVLITTKSGKTGAAKFDLNIQQGIGQVGRKIDMLNTSQYLEMRREAFANDKASPGVTDYDLNGTWDQQRHTDWQNELIGGTAHFNNTGISLSQGTEQIQYLIGGNYNKQSTVFPGDKGYQKASANFNLNYVSLNQKFKAQFSGAYNNERNDLFSADLTSFITLAPNSPEIYKEGKLNWENGTFENPFAGLLRKYQVKSTNINGNLLLNYKLLSGLQVKTSLGYSSLDRDELQTNPLSSYNPFNTFWTAERVTSNFADNKIATWLAEPQLSWNTVLGKGKLQALIGASLQQSLTQGKSLLATGFSSDALVENILSAGTVRVNNTTYLQYRYAAIFGRLNYNLSGKYLMNLTARRDGSTRFGTENRFANFGAIGAAWIFSEENLIKKSIPFLSTGKLRLSYGSTGNDQIGDYKYMELWGSSSNPYDGAAGLSPVRIANPIYAWELNRKFDAAIELGIARDKFQLFIDYYHNRSSNLLIQYALPGITGFTTIQDNLPATVQNKGWEIDLTIKNINQSHFSWSTAFNISLPKTKLIAFPNFSKSNYANRYEIGKSLALVKNYHTYGVDPQTGIYTYQDFDGDNKLTVGGDRKGQNIDQQFYGGFQNSFRYKHWELDFQIQFVKQQGLNYLNTLYPPGYGLKNQPIHVLNRWQQAGDVSDIQRFTATTSAAYSAYYQGGDQRVSDASFIRMKNVYIAYLFPEKIIRKIGMKQAKINLSGQNLFTISKFLGLDPETQSIINLPPLRMITAGLNLTF